MAILKHIASKSSNYDAALEYLIFKHDELRKTPILDQNGNRIMRDEFYLDGLNCEPYSFDAACQQLNREYQKNKNKNEIKSHHYIISFDPRDSTENCLTGKRAQELGLEYAKANFPGHQALVCTHMDGHNGSGNIHVHIRDYLNDLKWDGTERISHALHRFLGAAEDELTAEALKIFLLGAIKRVFHPGCKFEMMLCLVGGQGAGKSSFFRLLAIKDEWFSDDLRRMDDDNVFRKLQGHWIMEMSEMIATANAKSIEEIKSFLSKQKETYKIPYETHPADRLRQCVFAGTTNRQDFLPRDRTGNRRFIPIPVDATQAEVHILDNEAKSRAYIDQLWAEAMTIYNSGDYKLTFSPAMQEALQICQKDFMQEDTQAGMIYAFLEDYTGDRVCSKQLYTEALGNLNLPAEWETRAICEIMTAGIANGEIKGWIAHKAAKRYPKYGVQKGWERVTAAKVDADGFVELTDKEAQQMGFPF